MLQTQCKHQLPSRSPQIDAVALPNALHLLQLHSLITVDVNAASTQLRAAIADFQRRISAQLPSHSVFDMYVTFVETFCPIMAYI